MKKLLLMSVAAVMAVSVQAFAADEVQVPAPQPCPLERCQKPGPEFAPDRMHRPPHFDMKKFEDELQLTDKQKEELKVLREKRMEAAKPIHEKLKAVEQEAAELRKELRDLRIQGKKDFESVLTNKQLKKLEKLKAERKAEFSKKHPDGFHKRPPMILECDKPCPKFPGQE